MIISYLKKYYLKKIFITSNFSDLVKWSNLVWTFGDMCTKFLLKIFIIFVNGMSCNCIQKKNVQLLSSWCIVSFLKLACLLLRYFHFFKPT